MKRSLQRWSADKLDSAVWRHALRNPIAVIPATDYSSGEEVQNGMTLRELAYGHPIVVPDATTGIYGNVDQYGPHLDTSVQLATEGIELQWDVLGGRESFTAWTCFNMLDIGGGSISPGINRWNVSPNVLLWRITTTAGVGGAQRLILNTDGDSVDFSPDHHLPRDGLTTAAIRYDGANVAIVTGGVLDGQSALTGKVDSSTAFDLWNGQGGSQQPLKARCYHGFISADALSDEDLFLLHDDPWGMFRLQYETPVFAFGPAAAPPGARPQGPLGHPLHGALAGPIGP